MPLLTPTTEPHLSNLEPSAILASRALRTYLNYLVDNMGNSLATINSQRVWLAVSFLTVIDVCRGQTDAFTRQVTCPDNNAITGYTNIPNLNADMADELTRITTGGGTVPADGYTVRLCPSNTAEFDVTSGAIRPVLGTLAIVCGSGTMTTNNEVCIIDGGQNQVVLDDSQVDGYTITDVSLQGVTFRSFGSRAVQMQASEPTTLNLQNVVWEVRKQLKNTSETTIRQNPTLWKSHSSSSFFVSSDLVRTSRTQELWWKLKTRGRSELPMA